MIKGYKGRIISAKRDVSINNINSASGIWQLEEYFQGASAVTLYNFTTHTFTSAGKYGRFGQTLANFQSAYSAQSWASNPSYFFQGRALGYQVWKVPRNGIYEIEAAGARGQYYSVNNPTYGAIIRARVSLNINDQLEMVVGQVPGSSDGAQVAPISVAGGGGGTFVVYYGTDNPIVVAGGAGGSYSTYSTNALHFGQTRRQPRHTGYSFAPNTDGVEPALGYGGSGYHGGGGGGLLGSGTFYTGRTIADSVVTGDSIAPLYTGGSAFNGGGPTSGYYAIGGNYTNVNTDGGFGGGGGGHGGNNSGGGGGGYSGGHGGQTSLGGSFLSGLGGGSFIIPSATDVATSDGNYDGSATFNGSAIINLNAYNTGSTGGGTGYGYVKITFIA